MDDRVDAFVSLATTILDRYLASDPAAATFLGDHRYDNVLADPSAIEARRRTAQLRAQLAELDAITPSGADDLVDAAVIRTALEFELLELTASREADWNPMTANPGGALHALISRNFAPWSERQASLSARLAAVPDYLLAARQRFGELSRIHTETAIGQLGGTISLIESLREDGEASLATPAQVALAALTEHRTWLTGRLDTAARSPRIGADLFAAKLALALDTRFDPEVLLLRAEQDLARITEQIREAAAELRGGSSGADEVREVLRELSADAPTDATIIGLCRDSLAEATAFVRGAGLVTVYDDPIEVVEMPEIDRGVAVAYCRPAGPLETAVLPTEYAVSPTPADWTPAQVASFYREYNDHMVHELTVHEAMPGHALQLAHANRHRGSTPARAVWWSGSFVEGWAVYAEELMVRSGYRSEVSSRATASLRMQQLKMQLRMIINTVLDVRYHCDDLDEAGAMELMAGRGFQEEGEALGKWRRVQLTSTQLSTYYVGYREVSDLVADLRLLHSHWSERELHDAVLAHGSPSVRHLRTLLGTHD